MAIARAVSDLWGHKYGTTTAVLAADTHFTNPGADTADTAGNAEDEADAAPAAGAAAVWLDMAYYEPISIALSLPDRFIQTA